MRNSNLVGALIGSLMVTVFVLGCWGVNLYHLATECDWEGNYRCETLKGVGIVPPVATVTVWFETDKDIKDSLNEK